MTAPPQHQVGATGAVVRTHLVRIASIQCASTRWTVHTGAAGAR
ncbi:hypothetical protein [Streptomyces sp. NPDC086989]